MRNLLLLFSNKSSVNRMVVMVAPIQSKGAMVYASAATHALSMIIAPFMTRGWLDRQS